MHPEGLLAQPPGGGGSSSSSARPNRSLNAHSGFAQPGFAQGPATGVPAPRTASSAQRMGSGCTDPQEQQCAEEECDPDECGDEKRPPLENVDCMGNDKRPYLPLLLFGSTLVGAIFMLTLEFPLIREELYWGYSIRGFFMVVYAVTLGTMAYCVLSDPGKLPRQDLEAYLQLHGGGGEEDVQLPLRCHKMWLFKQPIKRYDHYCRWLTNAIGLLNHREFVVMLIGLATIGVGGCLVDFMLIVCSSNKDHHFFTVVLLILHLTYSIVLSALAGPILRLHAGFVSRNEVANEWKQNNFYIIRDERTGKMIPVNDLDEEAFNQGLDNDLFEYDPSRNPLDKGWAQNCVSFWCVSRWSAHQLGEF